MLVTDVFMARLAPLLAVPMPELVYRVGCMLDCFEVLPWRLADLLW